MDFSGSSAGKESTCNAGDPGSIPGSRRSPGEWIGYPLQYPWASLVAQLVKNSPAVWETWVWSLGLEDPLENRRATHSIIFAWKIPWTEEPSRLQSTGLQRVRHDWATFTFHKGDINVWPTHVTAWIKQFSLKTQLSQLTKEVIENLNSPVSINKIDYVLKY